MPKREAQLKSAFFKELTKQCSGFYVLMHTTRSAPDRSITGAGRTSFWEYKHCTPGFESSGDQELMCMRLAVAGYCRYVLWWETAIGTEQRTMIVHPRAVHDKTLTPETWCLGHDHNWLVQQVKRVHRA